MASAPRLQSLVHVALTVTDMAASTAWYETICGLERVSTVPHEGGYGVVLATPDRMVWWALHEHAGNDGSRVRDEEGPIYRVALGWVSPRRLGCGRRLAPTP
jgi:catechol 2,3-dioxygenase-like lactoylglutathione lyase family enzyme